MTKTVISIVIGLSMLMPASVAFASIVSCGEIDPVTNLVRDCGNGSPEIITNGYGVRNVDVPHVKAGAAVADDSGLISYCPTFLAECLDVSHTVVYIAQQRAYAQQSGGIGSWVYWLTH